MHLLFLTTNNLATNPRLYKELRLAIELNHICSVVQFKLGNWSDKKSYEMKEIIRREDIVVRDKSGEVRDENGVVSSESKVANRKIAECNLRDKRKEKRKVGYIEIDATSKRKFNWLRWGLFEKFAQVVYSLFKNIFCINALASSRRSLQILCDLKKTEKPDLIIAHNLGALYPAYKLALKWNIPFVFDVEDYHPGESIKKDAKNEQRRREFLMKSMLPKAAAITSASPLIGQYTMNLIGGHPNHQVIINSFPKNEFHTPHSSTALSTHQPIDLMTYESNNISAYDLKLVWFSQKISFGRGLEQLLEALIKLNNLTLTTHHLQLTLIGDPDPAFNQQIIQPFITKHSQLTTHSSQLSSPVSLLLIPPLSQQNLHAELSNHDVGLALEFSNVDFNRQLCLTNKIIAYSQAGLYIMATETPAQQQFIEEEKTRGIVCGQTPDAMADALQTIIDNMYEIRKNAIKRFEKGNKLTWEKEREKLTDIWKQIPGFEG